MRQFLWIQNVVSFNAWLLIVMLYIVSLLEAFRFAQEAFVAVGTPVDHAKQMADVLVDADYKGHFSHGLNRLVFHFLIQHYTENMTGLFVICGQRPQDNKGQIRRQEATRSPHVSGPGERLATYFKLYIDDIHMKKLDPNARPKVLKESSATAWVDGNNALGPIVGNFCMQLAIRKAKKVGVGWVAVKNTNHFGTAGYYSRQALRNGLIGMAFTNTPPALSPTRSKEAALGTNPLSVAAPGVSGDSFVLDMSTTTVAVGKIEIKRRKGELLEEGWAQGPDGQITLDPTAALQACCLMPLGGSEKTSGYKGYGLALMVDTFCGILAGAKFGPDVMSSQLVYDSVNMGQSFVAIDPSFFAPGFKERMSCMNNYLRCMDPVDPQKPVLVPGDVEVERMYITDKQNGIRYMKNLLTSLDELAEDLRIAPLSRN